MKILFLHQGFPGQFKHLAPELAKEHNVNVLTISAYDNPLFSFTRYSPKRSSGPSIHPWLVDFETKVIRADSCMDAAIGLRDSGYYPDVVIFHPGWGETLFLDLVWPKAKFGMYCEFYYHAENYDLGFDPEFGTGIDERTKAMIRLKNINNDMHFKFVHSGISPTHWQANSYPEPFRDRIQVIHDGIDTDFLRPNPNASIKIGNNLVLNRSSKVITFVNRNLEPYRGYHTFTRALPAVLKEHKDAHVLIVGGDGVSYGSKPPEGTTWKDIYATELRAKLTASEAERVHFLGCIPYETYIAMLQVSTVHVYLTYPFVLSWSLLEAMSTGCCVIGSKTPPVEEVITDRNNGFLVDFFDNEALANKVSQVLADPFMREEISASGRQSVTEIYDLKEVCLPRQILWVNRLANNQTKGFV